MDRITGTNTVDIGGGRRGFRSKDTVAGLPGTVLTAAWLNAMQEEAMALIVGQGINPSAGDLTQMLQAIRRVVIRHATNAVTSAIVNAPPGGAAIGDTYIIGPAPTGAWAGQAGQIAIWDGVAWGIVPPREGMTLRAADTGQWFRRQGASWLSGYAGITSSEAGVVTLADAVTAQSVGNSINPLTPATLPFAQRNTYRETEIFTASGTWTRPTSDRFIGCEVMVMGAGAGGAVSSSATTDPLAGGGGGNGAQIEDYYSRAELSLASYSVSVGVGGAGIPSASGPSNGNPGGNSGVFGITANGGLAGTGLSGSHGAGGAAQSGGTTRAGKSLLVAGTPGDGGFPRFGQTYPTSLGGIGRGGFGGYRTTGGIQQASSGGGNGVVIITSFYI